MSLTFDKKDAEMASLNICVLLGTTGVHQIEHHCLLIVEEAGTSIGNHLIGDIQQGRDDLQARVIESILPFQQFK